MDSETAKQQFTLEAVRQFMLESGGMCTNHDLVAYFKPLLNHTVRKLENRNKLKEFVQLLASVETKDGEKVLVLKKRYQEQGCQNLFHSQSPSGPTGIKLDEPSQISVPQAFNSPVPTEQQPIPPQRTSRSNSQGNGDSSFYQSDQSPPQEFGFYSAGAYSRGAAPAPPPQTQPPLSKPDYVETTPAPSASVAPWDRHVIVTPRSSPPPPVIIEKAPAPVSQPAYQPPPPRSTDNGSLYRSAPDGQSDTASISSSASQPSTDMGFYSNLVTNRSHSTASSADRSSMVRPASPPPAPPLVSSRSQLPAGNPERHTTNGDENTDPMAREEHLERTPGEPFNSETLKKTPMSAKDRIKQFDQTIAEQASEVSKAPRRNNRHMAERNQDDKTKSIMHMEPEYDGEFPMEKLDTMEKDWLITSSGSDYHKMCVLLRDRADLAHRRDFINGYNAMHWAAKHGKPDVIKMLQKYQVDPNLKSHCGYTPLHLAAMAGNEECIDVLVNLCKVKPNTRDFYGKRPKQYLNRNCSTRIQQMLLNNARQSFAVGNTVDDASNFARTQSFSAKIMKTTQGLARKFSSATTRASTSSDNIRDIRDPINESPDDSPRVQRKNAYADRSSLVPPRFGMGGSEEDLPPQPRNLDNTRHSIAIENYAMSRSESAPEIPPSKSDRQSAPVFTNIREF